MGSIESTIWTTTELAFAGVSTILVYLFAQGFLKKKSGLHISWKIFVILAVFATKFLASYYHIENILVISSVTILSAFAIGKVCFQAKVYWAGLSATFSFLAGVTSELLAVFVITSLQAVPVSNVMQLNIYRLQGRTLSFLFLIIIIVIVGRFRVGDMGSVVIKGMLALCIPALLSILIVQQYAVHIFANTYIPTVNEVISMISILTVNIFVFILIEGLVRQEEKNRILLLVESQSDAQQKHIQQLLNTHKKIRKMSHDFKHQVQVLYTLCQKQEYDELLTSLAELSDSPYTSMVVSTGNTIMDAILSSKKEEAEKNGIDIKTKLDVCPNLPYMSMEICVLLGNALNNAIEACMRSEKGEKIIELELIATTSKFLLRMKNTIGEAPQPNGEFLITKKSDSLHHGVGLESMKRTCKELDGGLTYEYDDRYFKLCIYIPSNTLIGIK